MSRTNLMDAIFKIVDDDVLVVEEVVELVVVVVEVVVLVVVVVLAVVVDAVVVAVSVMIEVVVDSAVAVSVFAVSVSLDVVVSVPALTSVPEDTDMDWDGEEGAEIKVSVESMESAVEVSVGSSTTSFRELPCTPENPRVPSHQPSRLCNSLEKPPIWKISDHCH